MSRSSKVVVLCEDSRTQKLVRRFLQRLSYQYLEIPVSPIGLGSAEQRVRQQYPREVAMLRRSKFRDQVMITVIEADTGSVDDRYRQLDASLLEAGLGKRSSEDPISLLIPRRNIETWIRVLSGVESSEEENYKPPPGGTRDRQMQIRIADAGDRFYDLTRPNAPPPSPTVDSLDRAIPEARKVPRSQR